MCKNGQKMSKTILKIKEWGTKFIENKNLLKIRSANLTMLYTKWYISWNLLCLKSMIIKRITIRVSIRRNKTLACFSLIIAFALPKNIFFWNIVLLQVSKHIFRQVYMKLYMCSTKRTIVKASYYNGDTHKPVWETLEQVWIAHQARQSKLTFIAWSSASSSVFSRFWRLSKSRTVLSSLSCK